jgi:hypothetical protein
MVGNSCLGWGEDHLMPVADENVWDKCMDKQPEAKEFQKIMLPPHKQPNGFI